MPESDRPNVGFAHKKSSHAKRLRLLMETALREHAASPYLDSVCQKAAGQSPYGMLTRIRMELIETLLTGSDYPIKVIASQCGYALPFSFTRAFTRHAGMPPAEYRPHAGRRDT